MGFFSKIAGSFIKERVSNTKTAFQLIVEDFRRYVLILKWIFLAFSAITLIYGIVTKTGNIYINCALLGLLAIYSSLDTVLRIKEKPNPTKQLRRIYAWAKIILNAAALGSSMYALYSATATDIKPIEIVLATLSIVMFVIKVVVEITFEIIQSKWSLLKNAMIMDAKEHPGSSAKIFAPFIGDVEELEAKESVERRIKERKNND